MRHKLPTACAMQSVSIIERAYQLAVQCSTILEVKAELKKEGYAQVEAHLSGRKIRADLSGLLKRDPAPGEI